MHIKASTYTLEEHIINVFVLEIKNSFFQYEKVNRLNGSDIDKKAYY